MSKKKMPPPRKPSEPGACGHRTVERRGPYAVNLPKGTHRYYQVYCTDTCGTWLRNEDA